MALAVLSSRLKFPDARRATPEGLVAVGGDLSVPRLLLAYSSGIFPWSAKPFTWWSPNPRGIFELDGFRVSRSLLRVLRRNEFQVTVDRAFREVMEGCASPREDGDDTWITPDFVEAYTQLHLAGHAHSVECWRDGELAGGVYGVRLGGLFAGESMFHRVSNASKVALFYLVKLLREQGFLLFDIQMLTPVTESLGAINISRKEYLERLAVALKAQCVFLAQASHPALQQTFHLPAS